MTVIIIVVFVAIIILRCNKAEIRGKFGEKKISLKLQLLSDEYHLFNDVYIQMNGWLVQIDHVIISMYGIFVIETKNYTGWIFGSDNSEYWTKNMYGNKYLFRNPLKQNYSHVRALKSFFGLSENKFIPIVVFLRGATLKCNTNGIVIYSSQLKNVIYNYTVPVFDCADVQRLVNRLTNASVTTKKMKKEHMQNVRWNIAKKNTLINSGICPRCNGQLVERRSQYGKFLGCSNYPRCRFTIQL